MLIVCTFAFQYFKGATKLIWKKKTMVALSWALLLPLQCCDTHEEKFRTQFDLEQNKMTMNF
jgi:hypothetical protein